MTFYADMSDEERKKTYADLMAAAGNAWFNDFMSKKKEDPESIFYNDGN